jgi:NAD(P)-dependent dehydrogenase (short-subunit alcohol dehydrogenase family)
MLDFTNHKVLVSGASSGLGKSVVEKLNSLGVFTVLCGRNEEKLINVQKELISPVNSEILVLDLENDTSLKPWLKESVDKSGKFSGFVHCAGIDITKPYKLLKEADFNLLYKLNITAPFQISKELVNKAFFNENGGSLLWISSVMGALGQKGKIAYTANKAAVEGLIKSYALELAPRKIRVNSVAPGIVKTPLTENLFSKLSGDSVTEIEKMHPLGFGEPEDVANLVAFLMSNQSKWITGTTHFIDGGYHLQ